MIDKLNYEEMVELRGKAVVGKHSTEGNINTTKQMKVILDKINEIIEHINKNGQQNL